MESYGPAVLRLAVGAIAVAHGAQRLFGVWGGGGLSGTAAFFADVGVSPAFPLAMLVAVLEFGGGLLLVIGALTRVIALLLAVSTTVAIWTVYGAHGFFINWTLVADRGHGYEFHLLLLGALVCLALTGPGALSIDEARARSAAASAAGRARLRGKM